MSTQSVLESGMRRARIDEICPPELPNVSESLKDFSVYESESKLVDANVVPDGIAQNLEAHSPSLARSGRQPFGPAFFVAASTFPNFSKFSRNMRASFFACPS